MIHARLMAVIVMIFGALAARGASAQTILFDVGHGERFKTSDQGPLQLSGLAEIFRASGAKIATLDKPISDASLSGADALVISGAFAPLSTEEIMSLVRFMHRGGKVAVMLHIAPPLANLLEALGISYTNGVIQERENLIGNDPMNFRVDRLGNHQLLEGVKTFSLYGVWGLINNGDSSRIIAATGPKAWVDLDHSKIQKPEETASFGVVVAGEQGKGGFLVFGDDAIFQNKFLDQNNKLLAANLAGWLK
jgi:hypothetical protein